jgi:nitrogenase molybdenum-iron protein alpha chain
MAINLKTPVVETREQRLGTIIRWDGKASELCEQSRSFCQSSGCSSASSLTEFESSFTQANMCSESITVSQATIIKNSVLIQHSPIGCAARQSFTSRNYRDLSVRRGWDVEDPRSMCTNLDESDMVFGGLGKLEQSIRDAYERHHPRVIFIATSCATGIIGDDVDSLATQMQEELHVTIVPLHCEGFKAKHWSTGWDVIEHGILRQLVNKQPAQKQEDLVNVIHLGGHDVFTPLLEKLGLRVNLVMGGTTLENLALLTEASATVTMCSALSYLATGLEQEYGVPEIRATIPYGMQATDTWLREVARVLNRSDRVEAVIESEHRRIAKDLDFLRNRLKGKKGFVAAGAAFAHGLIANLRELGVEIEGSYSYHHDPVYDGRDARQDVLAHVVKTYGDIKNYTVSNDQHFQEYAVLQRAQPDFVVTRHGTQVAFLAANLGIPVLQVFYSNDGFGYDGLLTIGRNILRILPVKRFCKSIQEHASFPYAQWWLQQNNPFALNGCNGPRDQSGCGSRCGSQSRDVPDSEWCELPHMA